MNAVGYYKKYNMEQLVQVMKNLEADPKNLEPKPNLHIYNKETRKKFADISQAITWYIIDKKKANGTYVEADGYSGRKSNKR